MVQAKLTFDGRDCMCDFECAEYNDCCEDSLYYKTSSDTKKKYYCSPNAKVRNVKFKVTDTVFSTCFFCLQLFHFQHSKHKIYFILIVLKIILTVGTNKFCYFSFKYSISLIQHFIQYNVRRKIKNCKNFIFY